MNSANRIPQAPQSVSRQMAPQRQQSQQAEISRQGYGGSSHGRQAQANGIPSGQPSLNGSGGDAYREGISGRRTNDQFQQRQNDITMRQGNRENAPRTERSNWQTHRNTSYGREAWRGNENGFNRNWDSNWRNNDRYNWSSYRSTNRTIFAGSRYAAPYRGYNYQRFGIGFSLSPAFYGSQYWLNDPYAYRLPEAYGPYRWVRYYEDVLLVNTYSGEVVDAIYEFFY